MSIGDLKTNGNKDNNFPWQLKMLQGQQCACDYLQQLSIILQGSEDYEAMLVVDANNITWLEIRVYNPNTGTFDPPVYYAAGSNTPGIPVAPLTYINPNTYLASIVSNTATIGINTNAIDLNTQSIDFKLTSLSKNPNIQRINNLLFTINFPIQSISIACTNSTIIKVSTNGGITFIPLQKGEIVNYDAGTLNNYFAANLFKIDTLSAGAEALITYIQ